MTTKKILITSIAVLFLAAAALFITFNSNNKNSEYNLQPRTADLHSSEFLIVQKHVNEIKVKIKKNPETSKNYIQLAQIFLQESRISGNHHYYVKKANELIDKALQLDNNNLEAMVTKASIFMTYHQFTEAKVLIEKVIAKNNYYAFAYGVLTDALVELGEYERAVAACDKMLSIRPDLRSYARASYLREINGQTQGAIDAMMLASNSGITGEESRAWTLFNFGNLFLNMGKLDSAEYIYKGILEERAEYGYALSGLADINISKKNYPKAISLLIKASHLTPNHIFIEKLADIYKVMGDKENEQEMINKVLDSFEQHEKDGYEIDKEYAVFCSNHDENLEEALERAKREYERRPLNIEALVAYAWALHKNGRSNDAITFMERATRLHTQKSLYYYQAAEIYSAAGKNNLALKSINEAMNINPYTKILYAHFRSDSSNKSERYFSAK